MSMEPTFFSLYWVPICWLATLVTIAVVIIASKYLSTQRNAAEDRTALASKISEASTKVEGAIQRFTTEFRAELRDQNSRISRMEAVHQRWGDGHLIDQALVDLKAKTNSHEEWIKSVRTSIHEVRNEVNNMALTLQRDIGELKQSMTAVATQVSMWDKVWAAQQQIPHRPDSEGPI